MKHPFLLLLLLAASLTLSAQCDSEYQQVLDLANESLQARDYQLVINRLLYAGDICPDRKDEVNGLIKQAFAQIEGEKETAEREKRRADSALNVANSVLDQLYFYEGKFGLTLKNISVERDYPEYRYGYIDRSGREVIPFEFEQASPFSLQDGFARVGKEGDKYLLDTLGNTYLLAEGWEELRPSSQALDLQSGYGFSLPDSIGKYTELRILLAGTSSFGRREGTLTELPASLGKLTSLQTLQLRGHRLRTLPEEIGGMRALQTLDLSYNWLESVPVSLAELQSLHTLFLRGNRLTRLPASFGELQNLDILYLGGNELSRLPASFSQLTELKTLSLGRNVLEKLPPTFGELRNLEWLDLRYNVLSDLPASFAQLQNLRTLHISSNTFQHFPLPCLELRKLEILDIGKNVLKSIPENISQLQELRSLFLGMSSLESLPESICQLEKLEVADLTKALNGNRFTHLPDCYLDKLSQQNLLIWAKESLTYARHHVAYETIDNLMRRFPETAIEAKQKLIAQLDALEEKGMKHEDFPRMRALLEE